MAAGRLAEVTWGTPEGHATPADRPQTKIHPNRDKPKFNVLPITIGEVNRYIKKAKPRIAAGSDEVPIELLKELNEESRNDLRNALNEWWIEESIPPEYLQARVVMIYKKGCTSDIDNYRPISLTPLHLHQNVCKYIKGKDSGIHRRSPL